MNRIASSGWCDWQRLFSVLLVVLIATSLIVVASDEPPTTRASITWSRPNQRVDDGPANSATPAIAVSLDGAIHVVWSDDRSGYYGIHYSKSTDRGQTWSASVRVDAGVVGSNARAPSIAIDTSVGPSNPIYVAWHESLLAGGSHIFLTHSLDSGTTWSSPVRVDTAIQSVICLDPDVTVGPFGIVYIAWSDNRDPLYKHIFVAKSTDGGLTIDPEVQVSRTNSRNVFPSLTTHDIEVYVSWQEEGASGLTTLWMAESADSGLTWTEHIIFASPSSTLCSDLDAKADSSGRIHAVWYYESAISRQISYSNSVDGGLSWSIPIKVDDTNSATSYMDAHIVPGPQGLYVAWSDNRNGDYDIFFSLSEDGGLMWGDGLINDNDLRVDDTDENGDPADDSSMQTNPALAVGAFGVFVVWDDWRSGTSYDIYFSSSSLGKIIITELRDEPDGSEIIEIYNAGYEAIDMTGYQLEIDVLQFFDLSALGNIPAMAYRTIGPDVLADVFVPFDLDDQGSEIVLFDGGGSLVDEVAYGQKGTAPDPLNGESVARHRIALGYTDEWVRESVPSFGSENNVPEVNEDPGVILNEILFHPAVADDAFVEVYYRGDGSISIADYKIVCNEVFTIPSIVLTTANRYYVLRFPTKPSFFSSMHSQHDNVYLYDSAGNLLDMGGWSSSHLQGFSMRREPEGNGTFDGYDDTSSERAGWEFDMIPTLPLVMLAHDYTSYADLGDRILFNMTVTNKQLMSDYIDIMVEDVQPGWAIEILQDDGVSPLEDSPGDGDGIPDSGLLSPEESMDFKIAVGLPSMPPAGNFQSVTVIAAASSTPIAADTAKILVWVYPHIEPGKTVSPSTIYHEDAGPGYQTVATLKLSVTGRGSAIVTTLPQDVIFVIDKSGSMGSPIEKFVYAKLGAKNYVDDMKLPDQGAVIFFDSVIIRRNPLSTDYAQIKTDIDSVTTPGGSTAMGTAINACWQDLVNDGDPSHIWVCILLSDGHSNVGLDPIAEAQNAAANNVIIYTIGLGAGADEITLEDIADITGGKYFFAESPEDLVGIYEEIGTIVDSIAGRDPDVTDNMPMIEEVIPSHIHVVAGSFRDPISALPKPPDFTGSRGANTIMQWNVSSLSINETWEVEYDFTTDLVGTVPVGVFPEARVSYAKWDGNQTLVPFPEVFVKVTFYAAPPRDVETFWDGGDHIGLRWVEIPWPELDHYLIYRAESQNGFQDLSPAAAYDRVTEGATVWVDPEIGGAASHEGEYYYLLRSANANESLVSETSNTAGAWTETFYGGFNTFSIPLEYFPWVNYGGVGRLDTVEEYRAAMGADYIKYMESEHWLKVPGSGAPAKRIDIGEGCLMSLAHDKRFAFVGLPGSMIRYDETVYAGFDYRDNAKSIQIEVVGTNIRITWQQPSDVDTYNIFYSDNRAGFYGALGTDFLSLYESLTLPPGPTASVDHIDALMGPFDELYYIIFPINDTLGLGSSSYSSGIWLGRFSEGYHAISLPLKPFSGGLYLYRNVSFYADSIPNTLVLLWFNTAESRWIPHIPAMEEGAYDMRFSMFVTLKLNVSSDSVFGFAGV